MRLPGYIVAFVLALLLASTTPVGTGAGAHQFDLLHPLFSHVHLVNGRILTHEQMAQPRRAEARSSSGQTVAAGDSAASADGGLGVSPTVPGPSVLHIWGGPTTSQVGEASIPPGRDQEPPDPPPL
jgi:hypothetical protein